MSKKYEVIKLHESMPEDINKLKTDVKSASTKADEAKTKAEQAFQAGSETKQKLVDKLTSVGVEASTNETFESLINKIETVSGKYAIIDINKDISMRGDRDFITTHIPYNLEFVPSRLIVLLGIGDAKNVSLDTNVVSESNMLHSTSFGYFGQNAMNLYYPKGDMYITNITQTGFDFVSKVYAGNPSTDWSRAVTIRKVEAL